LTKKKRDKGSPSKLRLVHEAEGAAAGAIAGAALGAAAGPPGALAGAIIGGVVGAVTGAGLDAQSTVDTAHERKLDEEIGVIGGEMGAPNLKHPPAKVGAYSSAAAGAGTSSDATPAEGPFSEPE
jgi:phage tail tape-measure protein